MIRHNLRRVRMNLADQTLHCSIHGLLPDIEAIEVRNRVGQTASQIAERNDRLGRLARVYDWIVSRLPARCEVVR